MADQVPYHVPVLLEATVGALVGDPSGVYVDVTFGAGGHAQAILQRLSPDGLLYGFDQDTDAMANSIDDSRLLLTQANFRFVERFLRYHQVDKIDGLLADLGVSSHQFDEGGRGFSYRADAALDMRMNQQQAVTAAGVLNSFSRWQLVTMFSEYGQVRNAKTLAGLILAERDQRPFSMISDLISVINRASRGNPVRYKAQVFQAIRIQVNDEINALRKLLQTSAKFLKPGGSLVVLTYHSVEDRLVKHFMKDASGYGVEGVRFKPLRKPVLPPADEVMYNTRASSAKLRIAHKLE